MRRRATFCRRTAALLPLGRRRRTRASSALLLYRSPRAYHAGSHRRSAIRGPGPRGSLRLRSERRSRCRAPSGSGVGRRGPQARRCQELRQLRRDLIRPLLHHRHRIHRVPRQPAVCNGDTNREEEQDNPSRLQPPTPPPDCLYCLTASLPHCLTASLPPDCLLVTLPSDPDSGLSR